MADPYTAFGSGLESGVRTGLLLGRAFRQRKDRKATEEALGLEAQISSWTPPSMPQQGIPDMEGETDPAATDGRTGPAQGYSGNQLRGLVEQARAAAARTGDPSIYVGTEGRILDTLTRKFQSHMQSGAAALATDPAMAVEEFAKASAYILDGNVPQFNVVTAKDGTPVVAHTVTDPRTGKPHRTALTKDMIDYMLLSTGTMEQFVSGTAGIDQRAAARYNDAVAKSVAEYSAGTSFIDNTRDGISEAFNAITPKAGETEIETTTFDPETGAEIKTKQKVPAAMQNPATQRAARSVAETLVLANVTTPPQELLRGGAQIISTVTPEQARDLTTTLVDAATKGDMSGVPGLTLKGVDGDVYTFTYFGTGAGGTIDVPKAVLDDVVTIANKIRTGSGLEPLGALPASSPDGAPAETPGAPTPGVIPTAAAATPPPGAGGRGAGHAMQDSGQQFSMPPRGAVNQALPVQ